MDDRRHIDTLCSRMLNYYSENDLYFQNQLLNEHNKYRWEHKLDSLVLNGFLCTIATNWANFLCEQNEIHLCTDLTKAKYSNNYYLNQFSNKLIKKFDVSLITQNLNYQRYCLMKTKADLKHLAKKISAYWYSDHNHSNYCFNSGIYFNNSIDTWLHENKSLNIYSSHAAQFLHENTKYAGFGYSKSTRDGSLYLVAFYYPF